MSLTPWNRQEEWYQQMINASTGNYLPSITAQDVGKVMTVESDLSYGLEDIPSQLPTVQTTDNDKYLHTDASTGNLEWSAVNEVPTVGSSDKGKYLHSDASTGNVEWADAPSELPAVTDVDAGKVLAVNDSGVWGAQEPIGKKFIVTLTIDNTEPIQGTMDKSIGEIEAAYNAGRRVEFELQTEDNLFIMPLQYVSVNGEIWSAYFSAITDAAMLFSGYTSGTSDKTSTDFGIDVYTLTPAT